MQKSQECSVCKTPKSAYVMNLKRVCMTCDELLFDMVIEIEEECSPKIDGSRGARIESKSAPEKS